MQDKVFEELRQHLASAEHVDVGQYQFINLEAVRAAAGTMWDTIRNRVFVASESIIRKHAGATDLVIQCATGFLVVYRGTDAETASAMTETIGADMRRFFLGERMTRMIALEMGCEQLSVAEFAATLDAAQAERETVSEAARAEVRALGARRVIDELVFWPAWDPRREAVGSFVAGPRRRRPDGQGWITGDELLTGRRGHEPPLELALGVLALAREALESLRAQDGRCGLIVPVDYRVLAHPPTRTRYVAALAAMAVPLRRLVFVKVEGAPLDAPAGQVQESCRTLLPYCGRLLLQAPVAALGLQRFENAGASLIGARLPAAATKNLAQDIERFAALARRIGLSIYFDGVSDWEGLKAALASPARLIAGPVFGQLRAPAPPYRLPRARALSDAA